MSWSDNYVGIPFVDRGRDHYGCDCYGLIHIIYCERLKINLPTYQGPSASICEIKEVSDLIQGEKQIGCWHPVNGDPQAFDVLSFRRGKLESHLGLHVHNNLMLHISGSDCAKLEDYQSGRWENRLIGSWRHSQIGACFNG